MRCQMLSLNLILLNLVAVWSQRFALYHALLKLVGFNMSGRCEIHAAMGI